MRINKSLLTLTTILLLTSCGSNSDSVSNNSNNSTAGESTVINSNTNKTDTKKDTTEPFVKKELTVDNIYNDFLSLASGENFTVNFQDEDIQNIFTKDYIVLNSSSLAYFKAETIYNNGSVGVYKANMTYDDNTGITSFNLAHLMEGEDDEGYDSDAPLEDFHTINYFSYLNNSNYGAKKEDLVLSSDGKEITIDYVSGEENRMFTIVCLMFNNRNNVTTGKVNHISLRYDENNNIVATFSYKEGTTLTEPSSYAYGVIQDIGTSSDSDAEEFRKKIYSSVGGKTFSYYNTYSIRNAYLSTNTNVTVNYDETGESEDYGTYQLDYNPYKMHLVSYDSSETFIRRTEDGSAYVQGINALNQVYDETYYSQNYANLTWGYKNFDFEGFRYSEDEKAYVYYGLNAATSLESISHIGLSNFEFDTVKLYVEDDLISKIVGKTASSYTQISETEYAYISYTITIDIVDYRTISEPKTYSVLSKTSQIQSIFNKVNDSDNTTFKTVAYEYYATDTKREQPVITTYYTHDVIYKETTTLQKQGNAYVNKKTGTGQYLIRDENDNPIGVKLFRVKADGTVEPRSEIIYGKTLKDYWINMQASPLVYEITAGNILSPRNGMTGNKLKDYLPISHSRFEAQEGSMSNGGDYTGMTFDLKKDENNNVTDEIESFHYYYGVDTGFSGTASGTGITEFTYGTEDDPITVSDTLLASLKNMGTFKIPTKWSESVSSSIYTAMKTFYQGKKNRYGQEVDPDRDIPYLFDDDLDESWKYSVGHLKNTDDLNINHEVSSFDDGDINYYNTKFEALLSNSADYEYVDSSSDPNFPGPYYYVNGDIVIGMTNSAYGGIYFYTAIPDYTD